MSLAARSVVWIGLCASFIIPSSAGWGIPTTSFSRRHLSRHHSRPAQDEDLLERQSRDMATAVLKAVFFQENSTETVEKALKVTLRSISDGPLRRRVSQLVLGTFVMQRRHDHVYNVTRVHNFSLRNEGRIRGMVDLHANYLNNVAPDKIAWPLDPVQRIALQHSMPTFLVQDWVDEYGIESMTSFCRISNQPGPITLRRNTIKCTTDKDLIERLAREEGVTVEKVWMEGCLQITSRRPKSIWAMSAWKDGWFEVQDAGSQLIVAASEVTTNDKIVVDFCAGNGGKTLALLSNMHSACKKYDDSNNVSVWAHDVVEVRLAQLRGSLARAGIANHKSYQVITTTNAEADLDDSMADVVLVDAPCSSCGVLRRRPSHRWNLKKNAVHHDFPSLQLEILHNASRFVKPGGRLVYATCSICRSENELVASKWEREQARNSWEPWSFDESTAAYWYYHADEQYPRHYCKLVPTEHNDGFFIARWKRVR